MEGAAQVVWNAAMREEVLAKLEAARADPSAAPAAASFRFKALEACPAFACLLSLQGMLGR